jgi:hypothetical protein
VDVTGPLNVMLVFVVVHSELNHKFYSAAANEPEALGAVFEAELGVVRDNLKTICPGWSFSL